MFYSNIQKKTQLEIWAWEFLGAILVLGGERLAGSQMAFGLDSWMAGEASLQLSPAGLREEVHLTAARHHPVSSPEFFGVLLWQTWIQTPALPLA